jgi:voltage-gated potassium channel
MTSTGRLLGAGIILVLIITIGTLGYAIIEDWSFFDSLYMTIITIATVGYGEVHRLTTAGRIFTIFLILGGMGGAFYALFGVAQFILEGQFGITLGRRRLKTKIANLKDHFILCGYGRVGEETAATFKEEGVPFVIVDGRPDCIARAERSGYIYIQGDATKDEVLREAGIERARGLVAAIGSDAENTYVTLSARGLSPKLFITARASDSETESKLKRAGANRVVSPNTIGGQRLAMLALRPAVVDFLDILTSPRWPEVEMANLAVDYESSLNGQTVKDVHKCSRVNVIAIKKGNGQLLPNPPEDEKVVAGDSLIVMGSRNQLTSLENVCKAN